MDPNLAVIETAEVAEAPLPAGTTRAAFCTGRYSTTADVVTGDRRLLDVLRDTTRHYLEVRRLKVTALDGSEQAAEYPEGLLHKADVDWVAIRAEPSRTESRLYSFVKKAPVRVALVLRLHRIEGNVFVENAATDPVSFFLRGIEKSSERFIAVTSAIVSSPMGTTEQAGLVIVNRGAVQLFSVVRQA